MKDLLPDARRNGVAPVLRRAGVKQFAGRSERVAKRGRAPGRLIEIEVEAARDLTGNEIHRLLDFAAEHIEQ